MSACKAVAVHATSRAPLNIVLAYKTADVALYSRACFNNCWAPTASIRPQLQPYRGSDELSGARDV